MPRNRSSNKLTDKYLQYAQFKQTSAASTALQVWNVDTGMSARGGWIWEVHSIEFNINIESAVVAAGSLASQAVAVSMLGNATTIPGLGDYGTLYWRTIYRIGQGTYNLMYWSFPEQVQHVFARPVLYAKPLIYFYYVQSTATATLLQARVGYVTKAATGSLLWETVEQFMSGI